MRNPVACVSCRNAKQKCIHRDKPPCDRCRAAGKADSCRFPPPGTSAIHRQSKRRRLSSHQSTGNRNNGAPGQLRSPSESSLQLAFPSGLDTSLNHVDPFNLLTDEVKKSYLRCSYKWCFHHTPTFLNRVIEKSLDPWISWSILALAVRFSRHGPGPYPTPTEASNAFAAHARQILQLELETPSISRIQALLMLTGHDWGAGNGRRAWFYLGMAIRMVQILNLCEEHSFQDATVPTAQEFIEAEERRRTAWTCFLMDSLLSGGKGRKRSLSSSDMHIQLPCENDMYIFGEPVQCERIDRSTNPISSMVPAGSTGMIGYSLRVADVWGEVAHWACSKTVNDELPWDVSSRFNQLSTSLQTWVSSLPTRLQYSIRTLEAHNALEQGQAFCYMHCIHFMSLMFLHRAHLPVLGPSADGQTIPSNTSEDNRDAWLLWRKTSRKQLFQVATTVCDMVNEMVSFGNFFLRGLVPWVGFTIYEAVGVIVYRANFHFDEEDDMGNIIDDDKERIVRGCSFLKDMKEQWPMAQQWFETVKRMQACYRRVRNEGGSSIPETEQRTIRNAIVDYGALQPSPVQAEDEVNTPAPSNLTFHLHQQRPSLPTDPSNNTPATADTSAAAITTTTTTTITADQPHTGPPSRTYSPLPQLPDDDAFFEGDWSMFDDNALQNADLDALFLNATQEFWGAFPGEVGHFDPSPPSGPDFGGMWRS
ncbi:fungal-specific transcription factor domain-containing protein [Phyllosticta citriasiana]|uniref:fungal-specific transcription factor domain-containing protein n=1 Tax=Phyllosticta citriasiana TaxID=595635 RepID=UPI0030FD3FF0